MAENEMLKIQTGEMDPRSGGAQVVVWDNTNVAGCLSVLMQVGGSVTKVTLNAAQVRTLRDRLDLFLGEQEEVGGEDAHLEMAYEDRFSSDD